VFDGVSYGALPDEAEAEVPTPTILDNLIAEKKIGQTVAILVWSMGKRSRDLTGSKPFSDFVADELVPWARSHYNVTPGPNAVVVAGSSFGGYGATYSAFTHPEAIGNVISQSGSYWISKNWQTVGADFEHRLYSSNFGLLFAKDPCGAVRQRPHSRGGQQFCFYGARIKFAMAPKLTDTSTWTEPWPHRESGRRSSTPCIGGNFGRVLRKHHF